LRNEHSRRTRAYYYGLVNYQTWKTIVYSIRFNRRVCVVQSNEMTTARCYTCHTLRPLSDFSHRRKDSGISASSRLRRYVGILFQRPGAKTYSSKNGAGTIYRYRCVHPRAGACTLATHPQRATYSASQIETSEQSESPLRLNQGQDAGNVGVHIEVGAEIQPCMEERDVFRREKDKARDKLRQCVDTLERNCGC
jgi:hypothetical protein